MGNLTAPNLVDISADSGLQDFADAGSEQDALDEYLANRYSETPHDVLERFNSYRPLFVESASHQPAYGLQPIGLQSSDIVLNIPQHQTIL